MVQGQHIMGPRGPAELNLIPVFKVMEMRGIEDKERCLELIQTVYHLDLKWMYDSR